jgi:ribosomal protein L11
MDKEIAKMFSIFLRSNKVESGPPLSTILGNFGINTVKFVKDFNDYTKDLPDYFLLVINVTIFNDKTYIFSLDQPSTSFLLRVISFEKEFLIKGSGGYIAETYKVIKTDDIILVSFFKYGFFNINTLKLILGTIQSMDLYVIEEL